MNEPGGAPIPLLSLRQVLVVNTSYTTAEREAALFGDPLESIWARCLAHYLGEPHVERLVLRVVADAGTVQRQHWLQAIEDRCAQLLATDGSSTS